MKNISVLGSTGSIGRQTLEVAAANPEQLKIRVLAAHRNVDLMLQQIELYHPDLAVLTDKKAADKLQKQYHGKTEILSGQEGLLAAATYEKVDTVLGAMVGYAGLRPTLAAINAGKDIALANKETLVAAGHIVMEAVKENHVNLLPVDSEHSAIFQSLRGGYHPCLTFTETENRSSEVKKLILTASGGPFRGKTKDELKQVSLAQCLKHPNWSMGKKVTIDSSTLANKGLEVMEAHWLFNMPYEKIEVVIHPQSIVHSAVQFQDGAVKAQLGVPDMRLPIQYAFSFPKRLTLSGDRLDLFATQHLDFFKPDLKKFRCLALAFESIQKGGNMPCIVNAANEIVNRGFLEDKCGFIQMSDIIAETMQRCTFSATPDYDTYIATDAEARRIATELMKK